MRFYRWLGAVGLVFGLAIVACLLWLEPQNTGGLPKISLGIWTLSIFVVWVCLSWIYKSLLLAGHNVVGLIAPVFIAFLILDVALMYTTHGNPFARMPTNLSWVGFFLVDLVGMVASRK